MSLVNLVWTTPNGESLIAYMARVSNPSGQKKEDTNNKLLKFLKNDTKPNNQKNPNGSRKP